MKDLAMDIGIGSWVQEHNLMLELPAFKDSKINALCHYWEDELRKTDFLPSSPKLA